MPLQMPSEAPPEAPRIALISGTQSWQVFASFLRIDINYLPWRLEEPDAAMTDMEFWKNSARFFSQILEEREFEVNRFSGVLEAAAETTDQEGTPDDYVRRHFLSKDLPACLDSSRHDCEAHIYRRPSWHTGAKEILLNKIFRIKALHAKTPKGKKNALFVEIDVNTVPDDPSIRFEAEELRNFYAEMPQWIDSTLKSCLEDIEG